jgi:tetratricopeptide (TPR) repeat protein
VGLRPRDCGSHRSRPAQFERKHRVQQSRKYKAKGDLDHATADFNQAIRINPRSAIAYFNRGIAYGLRREFDRALVDLNEAFVSVPRTPIISRCAA